MQADCQHQPEEQLQKNSSNIEMSQKSLENDESDNQSGTSTDSTAFHKLWLTSAERSRAHYQHQCDKWLQEADIATPQNAPEIDTSKHSGNILGASNHSAIIHKKPQLTSTEKSRAYCQRQHEKWLQKMAATGAMLQNAPEIDASEHFSNIAGASIDSAIIHKKPLLTPAEKSRAYRQRQREKRLQAIAAAATPQNAPEIDASEHSGNISGASIDSAIIQKKPRLTPAEKSRAYRQRQREKWLQINAAAKTPQNASEHSAAGATLQSAPELDVSEHSGNISGANTNSAIIDKKPRLTPAEKSRAYRQRQREKRLQAIAAAETQQNATEIDASEHSAAGATLQSAPEFDASEHSDNISGTNIDSAIIDEKSQLTSTEKSRAYPQRQRKQRLQEIAAGTNTNSAIIAKKPRMTPAEKTRAYRQRQREKRLQAIAAGTITESAIIQKKPRLTPAEKSRAYRQRQREKQMQEIYSAIVLSQYDCENVPFIVQPKPRNDPAPSTSGDQLQSPLAGRNGPKEEIVVQKTNGDPSTPTLQSLLAGKPGLVGPEADTNEARTTPTTLQSLLAGKPGPEAEELVVQKTNEARTTPSSTWTLNSWIAPSGTRLSDPKDKKTPLTLAEQMQAYHQHQPEKEMQENSSALALSYNGDENIDSKQLNKIASSTTDAFYAIIGKKHPMTSAEKMRAYRQRKREKRMQEFFSENSDSVNIQKMTSAEKMRAYRQRQREKRMQETGSVIIQKMTSAEKMRAYRQRQREKRMQEISTEKTDSVNIPEKKTRLTSAEKVRAWRQRQRLKRIQEIYSALEMPQNECENSNDEQYNNIPSPNIDISNFLQVLIDDTMDWDAR